MSYKKIIIEALDEENLKVYHSLKSKSNNYSDIEKMFIYGWGSLLYLSVELYKTLPNKLVSNYELEETAKEYVEAATSNNGELLEELNDWLVDGGPFNSGKYLFNYKRLDQYLRSAAEETKLPAPLTIFRSDESSRSNEEILNEWQSWSVALNARKRYGNDEDRQIEITLPAGTPVIYGHELADEYEIIFKGPIPSPIANNENEMLNKCIEALKAAGYTITK